MPLIFDNTIIEKMIFNQTEVDKAIFNGETIFEKIRKIVYTPELVSKIISPFGETVNLTVESPQGGGEYDTTNITIDGSVPISNLSFNKNTNVLSFNTSTCDKGAKTTVKLPVINCVDCFDYILPVDIDGCTHPNMTYYAANSPTCTEAGNYAYYKCSCSDNTLNSSGNLYDPNRSSLGHSFTSKIISPTYKKSSATCTSAAVYYYACATCREKGTSTFRDGSALGHDYTSKNTSSTYLKSSATCTSAATYYYSCSVCGDKGTSTFTSGSTSGHSYTQNKIWSESRQLRTAATCTAAATYWVECDNCTTHSTSKYFSSGSSLGHDYTSTSTSSSHLKSSATCGSAAVYYYSCTRCSANSSSTFTSGSPTGNHNYVSGDKSGCKCSVCGATTGHTRDSNCTCTRCGMTGLHSWSYCTCTKCGKSNTSLSANHKWVRTGKTDNDSYEIKCDKCGVTTWEL